MIAEFANDAASLAVLFSMFLLWYLIYSLIEAVWDHFHDTQGE